MKTKKESAADATKKKAKSADVKSRVTYKVPEAAQIAGCGERSIRNGIDEGRIPHIKFGRNIFIPRAAFLRWLDSCGGQSNGGRTA